MSSVKRHVATKFAKETLSKYTIIANDHGLKELKDKLEDSAFKILHPKTRDWIISKVKGITDISGEECLRAILENLKKTLTSNGLHDFQIIGRKKTPFSIWQKLKRKGVVRIEDIRDILGFRVVVNTIPECYETINILHSIFLPVPNGFKDYILFPKSNVYRSLHTSIIGPYQKKIEVQVRTVEMDRSIKRIYKDYWKQKTLFY